LPLLLLAAAAGVGLAWALRPWRDDPPTTRLLPPHAEPELVRAFEGPQARDAFGSWIASGVDLDGDGLPESLIGAPEDDSRGLDVGRAVVYSGRTGSPVFEVFGDASGAFLGERVGFGPDVTGDGIPEVLARARGVKGASDRVMVFSGADGGLVRQLNANGTTDELGTWLLVLPDLDGDGTRELAVGAPGRWDAPVAGRAHVFSGATGAVLRTFIGADRPFDRFGFSMAVVGDQDGDGAEDLAVSSLDGPEDRANAGTVRLFSLADGRLLSTMYGTAAADHFGHELATAPDSNGDGRLELLVGSFRADGIGYVRLVDPLTGAMLREHRSDTPGDGYGHAVAVIGDVDADAVTDWAIGAPNATHPPSGYHAVGSVHVVSGATGAEIAVLWGPRERGHFGYAIAPAGDVDADGRADALVGTVVEGEERGHARIVAPAKGQTALAPQPAP
jgi:hypothetical protein